MTQTYRTDDFARWGAGQGFNLTPAQVDINFWDTIQRVIALEALPDAAAGIAYFEIVGVMMYVHMTDGEVLGPYELPMAIFRDRGEWAPATPYSKMDTFSINGGLYAVTWDHTSDTVFDPGANDGAGNDYYQLMIQTPGSALPSGGIAGAFVMKSSEVDYAVTWGYPDASDVTFTPATGSALTSSTVADALEEVAGGGGDAANISYTPGEDSSLTSDNVQDALDELGSQTSTGLQTIWVPASAMTPRITSGPAIGRFEMPTNKNLVNTLDFDPNTAEYAQFDIAVPRSWDSSVPIWGKVFWSHTTFTTGGGTVVFILDAVCITPGAGSLDAVFDGRRAILAGGTANRLYSGDTDEFLILNGTTPMIAGDLVSFRMWREATNFGDNMNIDARLHGVQIFYTTNAATDDE